MGLASTRGFMKRKNITTLLSRIALEQDAELQQLVRQFAAGKKTDGTPVAIRFRPAVRVFITRVSQSLGISVAELVNILIEGMMAETLFPRQAAVTRIYERFWLLMDAHWLSMTNVATLLAGMNMGLSVLESRDRTLDYLTAPVIRQLAAWFGVTTGWLDGTDDHPVKPVKLTSWYEVAAGLFTEHTAAAPVITLVRPESNVMITGNLCRKNDTVACVRQLKQVNGIAIRVVTFTGIMLNSSEGNNETDAFLAFCETMRKASRLDDIETLLAPEYLFTQLISGSEIPASFFSALSHYHIRQKEKGSKCTWHDDEVKGITCSSFYLSPEWKNYAEEIIRNIPVFSHSDINT